MPDCLHCGAPFEVSGKRGGKPRRYCTAACRVAHHSLRGHAEVLAPSLLPNPLGGRQAACPQCHNEFTTRLYAGGRRQQYCSSECQRENYRTANIGAGWLYSLAGYGMTEADYQQLFDKQCGVCAICGRPPHRRRLAVDHDHKTGSVRGLLCDACNRHVGYFEQYGCAVQSYLRERPQTFGTHSPLKISLRKQRVKL